MSVHDKDGSDDDSDEEDEEKEGEPMFTVSRDSRCASGSVHCQEVMFTDPLTWKGGCVGSGDLGRVHCLECRHIILASFPGPAQLFIACSMEKRGEPGMFPHGCH